MSALKNLFVVWAISLGGVFLGLMPHAPAWIFVLNTLCMSVLMSIAFRKLERADVAVAGINRIHDRMVGQGRIVPEGNKTEEVMREARLKIAEAAAKLEPGPHYSHTLRCATEGSSCDYICDYCSRTDTTSGWGLLAEPCPASTVQERSQWKR